MTYMHFLSDLTVYLRREGEIYTVRRFKYTTRTCYIPNVGACSRVLVKSDIKCVQDLAEYCKESGLETADAWWKKIKEINNGKSGTLYMYLVRVIRPISEEVKCLK